MGLFPALAEAQGRPETLPELASMTKVDLELLSVYTWTFQTLDYLFPLLTAAQIRFLRAGVSFGAVREVGADGYCQTHQHSLLVHYCHFLLLHICYTFISCVHAGSCSILSI